MAAGDPRPPVICVLGPTASGKTDLAIGLAGHCDCELVSVDSTLVYRGLDIGSAKPDYPHHLVDICDPAEVYSAARFAMDARTAIADITRRGRTPLLVGGTMLYFRALLTGLSAMPASDPQVRGDIEREAQQQGWPALHRELGVVDPEAAARIHPNHSQRLGRALEVFRSSGVPISEWQRRAPEEPPLANDYRVVQLGIRPLQRAVLHRRIEQRFQAMLAGGFLEEVAALHGRGDLHPALPSMRAVGYRQLWQHLDGQLSLDEAVANGIAATRQLAKRQLTWLRKWPGLSWILTDEAGHAVAETPPELAEMRENDQIVPLSTGELPESALVRALRYLERGPM